MFEELSTVDAVIDALGGTKAVASFFMRTDPAVSNWRKAAQFPAYTYIALQNELQRVGKRAPASLWSWAETRPYP